MSVGASQNQLSTRVGSSCPQKWWPEGLGGGDGEGGGVEADRDVHPRGKGGSGDQAPVLLAYPKPSKFTCKSLVLGGS